ncbi:MAG: helix-turn-helix domain-containing protein [Pseudohongiella sp.]|nr:helix-turn-helix domain-containing protein [Pseudohongiella sp.]MDO9520622.1 helix-turn-helix domain-containing protein [Pseudohongiella sp.]MDP2127892.1 helix-turn-helix domain-containing protein [Pseudohongiella sp.]
MPSRQPAQFRPQLQIRPQLQLAPQPQLQPQHRTQSRQQPQQNHLLAALSPEVQCRMFPDLELVQLPLREILFESGRRISHVYFPTDSVILTQYMTLEGSPTAVQMVGCEGLLGLSLFLGAESTPSESLVQIAGFAYRIPRRKVEEEFSRHGQFLDLVLRYAQSLMTQASQTAACNRRHSIDQQLCRWLLHSIDRQPHNQLAMTQEFIGNMLGVRREGVSQAALKLQAQGVISYTRGMITVLDRRALESLSCECYGVVKKETDRLLHYVPQCRPTTNPHYS